MLGIIHCKKEKASEFEEDHGLIVVRQLVKFLTKFCTPLGRSKVKGTRGPQPLACDLDLKAHLMKTVSCVAADGGSKERRTVFLVAREIFPKVLM